MSGLFGHGDFRVYLLKLLEEEPRHGYELIRLLEDATVGLYTPSAGSVYPRLQALEEEGLIEHDEVEGKKVYRITLEGKRELRARKERVDAVDERLEDARRLARDIRNEVRSSVRDLRRQLRDASTDARTEAREEMRRARDEARRAREEARDRVRGEVRRVRVEVRSEAAEAGRELRALGKDLEAFAQDLIASARQNRIDRDRLSDVRILLRDARGRAIEILTRVSPPQSGKTSE